MGIHIITGGSGQGKTEYMVRQLILRSEEDKKGFYYMIVPEQFSLEMQRKMILSHPRHGYSNIDVLSFHRLAFRIFEEAGRKPPEILEDLGVSMILRKILSEQRENLRYFKKNAGLSGFADEMRSALMELISFDISWQDLADAAERIKGRESLADKCRDLSRLYQCFEKEIEGRYLVSEQLLTAAGELFGRTGFLQGASFYFDGFTGFTPVQREFIRCLAGTASEMTFSLTTPRNAPSDEDDLFVLGSQTIRFLMEVSKETGMSWGDHVHLDEILPPRFVSAPDLAVLERTLYQHGRQSEADHQTESKGNGKAEESGGNDSCAAIHMVSCRNPSAEADFVLHKIEELVRREGYRYRDCAVLAGQVDEYMQEFVRQADILRIPLFEDVKKRLSYHSGIEGIRALFHLAEYDYSYESVFRYLKSGMSALSDRDTDFLENYVLYAGIRGYSAWKKPFSRRLDVYRKEEAARLELCRQRFMDETETFVRAAVQKDLTVRDKIKALIETMDRMSWHDRMLNMAARKESAGDLSRAREYELLFPLLMDLFRKIVRVFGQDIIKADLLSDIVDTGLESLGLGVPPLSMDQVILGDLKRTRLPEVKVLFVVGFNDGIIPPLVEERGVFSDEDKEVLAELGMELSSNRYEQTLEDEFYTYLALTRPSRLLYFSMSDTSSGGEALRPSSLVPGLKKAFPELSILRFPEETGRLYFNADDGREFLTGRFRVMKEDPTLLAKDRAFRALAGYMAAGEGREDLRKSWDKLCRRIGPRTISDPYLDDFYGKELRGSVSRLEKYAACPFQYFIVYGLGLQEREEFDLRANDQGSLFHKALENFSRHVKEDGTAWKDLSRDRMEALTDQSLDEALEDKLRDYFESSARSRNRLARVRRVLLRTVSVIRRQLEHSAFEPDRFEMYFGDRDQLNSTLVPLERDRVMHLSGIVDRVDVCEEDSRTLVRVVDYKSGENKLSLDDVYHGLRLQLALYMMVVQEAYEKTCHHPVEPGGLFYYHMKDPLFKGREADENQLLKEFKMKGYANADPDILKKLEDDPDGFISMGVRVKKDGKPYKDSPVLTTEDFQELSDYLRTTIADLGSKIYSGDVTPRPYEKGRDSSCTYCPAREICQLDPREDVSSWRLLSSMKADEVMEAIRNKTKPEVKYARNLRDLEAGSESEQEEGDA